MTITGTTAQQKSKSILLVDDDLDDRELFVEAVGDIDNSAKVSAVDDSENLIEYLLHISQLPDYLFLDLNMPRKSGKECLREIYGNERFRNMKIVIYTTSINPKDVTETYQQGAFCFVQKPNSYAELKDMLSRVIQTPVSTQFTSERFILSTANPA